MGTVLDSIDNLLASAAANGLFTRLFIVQLPSATTAATIASGYISAQRYPRTITIPALGSGLTGVVFPYIKMLNEDANTTHICAVEYDLGTLNVATGVFTAGVTMPTKTIRGSSIQTATQMVFLVATATLTAATPLITITYTNQGGTPNRSAALTLPTNAAIYTAFDITPHLNSADTGIQAVTNMTKSAGTVGTLKVYGLLVLATAQVGLGIAGTTPNPITVPHLMWKAIAAEVIAFYRLGGTTTSDLIAMITGVADN